MNESDYIGKHLDVVIDRPLGSYHPIYNYQYPVNYGYIPNTCAGDHEELDAYVLCVNKPLVFFAGKCIAVIERMDDHENKLVIVPDGIYLTDDEIYSFVEFQERYFKTIITR